MRFKNEMEIAIEYFDSSSEFKSLQARSKARAAGTTKGVIRTQFHRIIDIVPTILEAARMNAPEMVNGIVQAPIEGVSMGVLVQFPINGCSFWQNDFLGSMPPRSPPRALERSLLFWSAV